MAEHVHLRWEPRFHGSTRRDRQGCSYNAYLPDPLQGWEPVLPGDLAADIAEAETAVRELNRRGVSHISPEGLALFLLRAEAMASSRIEGLSAGRRRLVEAEAVLANWGYTSDREAVEILSNITAMETAMDFALWPRRLSWDVLLHVHRRLLETSSSDTGGVVRTEQNWIGGSSHNPCRAAFVPPPPEYLDGLLNDLMEYVNDDRHSPLTQAAIAHAQFEAIHPFADGNGRTGRSLIHIILRRRGLAPSFVPPVSLALAARPDDYIAGLMGFCHLGPPDGPNRSTAAQGWLRTFASAVLGSCREAQTYANRIEELNDQWRADLGAVRANSTLDRLLRLLPGTPLLTAQSAADLTERSQAAANLAIRRLREAGILIQKNIGKYRYRIFESPAVLDLLASLEKSPTTPIG